MSQSRNKNLPYITLRNLSKNEVNEESNHDFTDHPIKSETLWSTLFEKLYRRKFQILFILLTCLIFLFYLALDIKLEGSGDDNFTAIFSNETEESLTTVLPNPSNNAETEMACKLPKLDPFDPSIKSVLVEPWSVNCSEKFPLIFVSTLNNTLVTVKNVEELYGNVKSCYYQTLVRGPNLTNPDNDYSLSEEHFPIPMQASSVTVIPPEHEFLVISCKFVDRTKTNSSANVTVVPSGSSDPIIFSTVMDMHFFVPEKQMVESRIEEYYENLSSNFSFNQNQSSGENDGDGDDPIILEEDERVNVVILGIDGVSNMNFIRAFPESYAYLRENLSAVAMQGFNKIADNTLPNLSAGLAGLNFSVLQSCENQTAFDECPFIWKKYAEKGYRTSFAEDSTWMGIFNYEIVGFREPPTDYYLRPFGVAAEKLIGTFRRYVARLCYGPRLSFEVLLDYVRKMAYTMCFDKRYFQFIWATSLTHDMLNYGKMGDKRLLETLKWFQDEGYFNKTVFILMSDHGIRWGVIHAYHQGHVEERLPFKFFIVPTWFQQKYNRAYENLKLNQDRLTTQFDFHETLEDFLDLRRLDDDAIMQKEKSLEALDKQRNLPRGISQFLSIPLSRTCQDAEIAEHYCTCHNSKKVDKTDLEVKKAANFVLTEINSMFLNFPACANLTIADITTSYVMDLGYNPTKGIFVKGYELSINTIPGDAVFEATVIKNGTDSWTLSGTVSRTNLRGNQSDCINERTIKLYCYCRNLIT